MASLPTRKASSVVNPWSTSCTTGRQVTISSKSTTDSIARREGRRNTSIHVEVSTRTTGSLGSVWRTVLPHRREVPLPCARAGQFEDPAGARPAHEVLHRALHGARVRPFAAQVQGLLQKIRVKHKIRAFHVYSVPQ